jgi:hypothetical protein
MLEANTGKPLTWNTTVTADRLGATVRYGGGS